MRVVEPHYDGMPHWHMMFFCKPELRKLPRGVSIADEFDERVEAARAAADEGEFDLYISAPGGANVSCDSQTFRVARHLTDEVNAYEEDIERVMGIYAPHLGSELVHVTRTAEWRIVPKLLAVEPLTLKAPLPSLGVLSITVGILCMSPS